MRTVLLSLSLVLALSACGNKKHFEAIALCKAEVETKIKEASELGRVDEASMKKGLVDKADGTLTIHGEAIMREGTPAELRQTFDCTVVFENDKAVLQQFALNW
jgi:hypothetical protein